MKFPKALSVLLTTTHASKIPPERPGSCVVSRAGGHSTAEDLSYLCATFMPLTLSLWNVRCRKEHSPVWCSPWPSGWRGSASPERPKHLHSLPYGQQNSLGKPRKTWWEHFNVPWSYLAQQDLILITWTWEDGARGILILCILSQSHNCPAGMGSAVIPMKFSIENNSSGSLFLWLFLHLVA